MRSTILRRPHLAGQGQLRAPVTDRQLAASWVRHQIRQALERGERAFVINIETARALLPPNGPSSEHAA